MASDPTRHDQAPHLIDSVKTPDPGTDPARKIEENGEPFEGNNA